MLPAYGSATSYTFLSLLSSMYDISVKRDSSWHLDDEQDSARKKVTRVDIQFFEIYRDRLKYIFHAQIEYPRCHRFYRLKCIFASKETTGPGRKTTTTMTTTTVTTMT